MDLDSARSGAWLEGCTRDLFCVACIFSWLLLGIGIVCADTKCIIVKNFCLELAGPNFILRSVKIAVDASRSSMVWRNIELQLGDIAFQTPFIRHIQLGTVL